MDIVCDMPAQIQFHVPSANKRSPAKRVLSTAQQASLCDGQTALRIPVLLNKTPLRCQGAVRVIQAERTYERFIRDLYSAEDLVREVQEDFLYGGFQSAYFTQTIRRGGKRATSRKLFGRLDFYEAGDVEWLFDSNRACHFSLRPDEGQVVAVKTGPRLQATKPIADFSLAPVSALAFSGEQTLDSYKAELTNRESKALVIELIPKTPNTSVERVTAHIAINRRRLTVQSVEIHMRNGDTVLTELRGLSYSEPPEGRNVDGYAVFPAGSKDFKVVPANKLGCKTQLW